MMKENWAGSIPAPKRAAGRLTPFRLGAHCYTWGLFLVLLAFAVPRAESIFLDFGVPLPRLTNLVVGASHVVARSFPPVVAIPSLLLLLLGADWLILNAQSERGEEGWALAWSMLMFASPLFLIGLTVVALVIPFLTITTRLSG